AGNTKIGSTSDFAVLRFNSDGTLDTNFSDDGIAVIFYEGEETAQSVIMQADEKILVAGYSANDIHNDFALVRLFRDGSIDYTFSDDGILISNIGGNSDKGHAVLVQAD